MTEQTSNRTRDVPETLPVPFTLRMELKNAVKELMDYKGYVFVICHNDADGLCGGAVLAKALSRAKIMYRVKTVPKINKVIIDDLIEENMSFYIFVDLGSGYVDQIQRLRKETGAKVIVLDHHIVKKGKTDFIHINCNSHGVSGSFELSGSMMSFLFSFTLDSTNFDLIDIAIAGAIGDKQNITGFKGANEKIVDEAVESGYLQRIQALPIYGDSISQALEKSIDPYFGGISGKPEAVRELLESIGISLDSSIDELSSEDKKRLNSALAFKMVKDRRRIENIREIAIDRYYSPRIGLYLDEMSDIINSCGKGGNTSLALAYALNPAKFKSEAVEVRKKHVEGLLSSMNKLESIMENRRNFLYFINPDKGNGGIIAGIAIRYLTEGRKPLLSFTEKDDIYDISARGTKVLVDKGLDLARAMSESSSQVGGSGGGHPVASGATIPKEGFKEFLDTLENILEFQSWRR